MTPELVAVGGESLCSAVRDVSHPEGYPVWVDSEAAMGDPTVVRNIPEDFDRFVAAPPHRLFAVFDDPATGEEAIRLLRDEGGLAGEDDIWVFFGEEGRRRLDLSGAGHGIGGEIVRFLQRLMSADIVYLHSLDVALREGRMVVAALVGPDDLDRLAALVRDRGGHSLARVAHWDYVPVAS